MSDPSEAVNSIEERKLRLEIDKFEFEKSKGRGLGFFNSNFGIIITGMIGIATIVVSYLQLQINRQSSDHQLTLQMSISDAQLALERKKAQAERDKDERTLQFDIARLLLEKQADISTVQVDRVYYLRDIVMSALPSDIGIDISRKMADNAPNDEVRSAWLNGLVKLKIDAAASPAPAPQAPLTADFILAQLPATVPPDAKTRIQDILNASAEFKVQDAALVMLAFALYNTNYFRSMEESLNYAGAQRLMAVWPKLFPTVEQAAPFVNNPAALADKVYGGRMGNVDPDDGWKYRGRGYLLTTGRSGYARASAKIGVDVTADPDRLLESKVAARELAANFAELDRPITVDSAVRKFNGALIGLAGVQAIFEKLAPGTPKVTQGLSIPAPASACWPRQATCGIAER